MKQSKLYTRFAQTHAKAAGNFHGEMWAFEMHQFYGWGTAPAESEQGLVRAHAYLAHLLGREKEELINASLSFMEPKRDLY